MATSGSYVGRRSKGPRLALMSRQPSRSSYEVMLLAEHVAWLAREAYGPKAWVRLLRESYGWSAQVWRSIGGGFLWALQSDSTDRSVVLGRLEEALAAMAAGVSCCRYCPRVIPAGYDGQRPCIARARFSDRPSRGPRLSCVPGPPRPERE